MNMNIGPSLANEERMTPRVDLVRSMSGGIRDGVDVG